MSMVTLADAGDAGTAESCDRTAWAAAAVGDCRGGVAPQKGVRVPGMLLPELICCAMGLGTCHAFAPDKAEKGVGVAIYCQATLIKTIAQSHTRLRAHTTNIS